MPSDKLKLAIHSARVSWWHSESWQDFKILSLMKNDSVRWIIRKVRQGDLHKFTKSWSRVMMITMMMMMTNSINPCLDTWLHNYRKSSNCNGSVTDHWSLLEHEPLRCVFNCLQESLWINFYKICTSRKFKIFHELRSVIFLLKTRKRKYLKCSVWNQKELKS